jgi:hypothetical protein
MSRASASRLLAAMLCLASPARSETPFMPDELTVGAFSRMAPGDRLPDGWELIRPNKDFPPTRFRLEVDGETTVVRADADRSMAGLSHKIRVDVKRLPYLCWRWKIAAPLVHADLSTKQGDDYAARLYVLFDYDTRRLPLSTRLKLGALRGLFGLDVPAAALNYVWDNRHPVGTVAPNAYTDRAMMWVLQSGAGEAGRWVSEVRDLAADFRRAFGDAAPDAVAVVIASDTDNTGETATAWFGDIRFAANPGVCARQ